MTQLKEIYKCRVCGNIVEVLHKGAGELVCCNQPMFLMKENTVDAAREKHIPVIEKTKTGIKIKVGEVEHPMTSNHYIEWIEIIKDERVCREFLKPGDKPKAEFKIKAGKIKMRAYCNLHGLWKGVKNEDK